MSATELATVVEGWATLIGLFVVIAGAVFAGVQLRQEAKARRLQALVDLFADVWPAEVTQAAGIVANLPDDYKLEDLSPEQRQAHARVAVSMGRLGHLMALGLVEERMSLPTFATALVS